MNKFISQFTAQIQLVCVYVCLSVYLFVCFCFFSFLFVSFPFLYFEVLLFVVLVYFLIFCWKFYWYFGLWINNNNNNNNCYYYYYLLCNCNHVECINSIFNKFLLWFCDCACAWEMLMNLQLSWFYGMCLRIQFVIALLMVVLLLLLLLLFCLISTTVVAVTAVTAEMLLQLSLMLLLQIKTIVFLN